MASLSRHDSDMSAAGGRKVPHDSTAEADQETHVAIADEVWQLEQRVAGVMARVARAPQGGPAVSHQHHHHTSQSPALSPLSLAGGGSLGLPAASDEDEAKAAPQHAGSVVGTEGVNAGTDDGCMVAQVQVDRGGDALATAGNGQAAPLAVAFNNVRYVRGCAALEDLVHVYHAARRYDDMLAAVATLIQQTTNGEGSPLSFAEFCAQRAPASLPITDVNVASIVPISKVHRIYLRAAVRLAMKQRLECLRQLDRLSLPSAAAPAHLPQHPVQHNSRTEGKTQDSDMVGNTTNEEQHDAGNEGAATGHASDGESSNAAAAPPFPPAVVLAAELHEQHLLLKAYRMRVQQEVKDLVNVITTLVSKFCGGLDRVAVPDALRAAACVSTLATASVQARSTPGSPTSNGLLSRGSSSNLLIGFGSSMRAVAGAVVPDATKGGGGVGGGGGAQGVAASEQSGVGKVLDMKTLQVLTAVARDPDLDNERAESAVFWLTLGGDGHRYLCATASPSNNEQQQVVEAHIAASLYQRAGQLCRLAPLDSTHPLRLSVALNHSVFLHDATNDVKGAKAVSEHGFQAAVTDLHTLEADEYKESTLLMQLMRHNEALWDNS